LRIYGYLVPYQYNYVEGRSLPGRPDRDDKCYVTFLQTNRMIYEEASVLLWKKMHFHVYVPNLYVADMDNYVLDHGPALSSLTRMRSLKLILYTAKKPVEIEESTTEGDKQMPETAIHRD